MDEFPLIYTGIVQRGERRGSALGFPTMNISFNDLEISGIYAARVIVGSVTYDAVVYADQKRKLLEAHLLDFSGDLYGQFITIELLHKIRDDKRFESDGVLQCAIADDVGAIRKYFKMK